MKIYLVQHGDAVPKEIDPERPLSDKGRKDVEHVAVFLQSAGIKVVSSMHSGKSRARRTAEILGEAVLHEGHPVETGGISPNDSIEAFVPRLSEYTADTMIVGHLPFMARLVSYLLTGDESSASVAYKPGSIVCMERNDLNEWSLDWMVRPDLLQRRW